jgi:hypothetical protein
MDGIVRAVHNERFRPAARKCPPREKERSESSEGKKEAHRVSLTVKGITANPHMRRKESVLDFGSSGRLTMLHANSRFA